MTGCNFRRSCAVLSPKDAGRLACLLLLAVLAGCAGTPSYAPRSEFIPFTPEQKIVLEKQAVRSYRIQEDDMLKVYFAYERNLNQDFVHVLSDGTVSLVGIPPVKLAGLTMAEADSVLTVAYSREYREPALSVMIQETRGRRIYVMGEVRDPGTYVLPYEGMDVMSAIALASGFGEDAYKSGTLVVRVTKDGYQFQEVNLDNFGTAQFAASAAVTVEPFDIIYVPKSPVGNFGYFAKNVLAGISYGSRILYDVYNISHGITTRY